MLVFTNQKRMNLWYSIFYCIFLGCWFSLSSLLLFLLCISYTILASPLWSKTNSFWNYSRLMKNLNDTINICIHFASTLPNPWQSQYQRRSGDAAISGQLVEIRRQHFLTEKFLCNFLFLINW